jgi:hypothetical protein
MVAFRYLDIILALVALPVLLALGAPALGSALGVGTWVLQRGVAALDQRWISRLATPNSRLRARLFEPFARIWLLVGGIIVAAVAGNRRDGLTAALVIFAAYSVAFVIRIFNGLGAREDEQ